MKLDVDDPFGYQTTFFQRS